MHERTCARVDERVVCRRRGVFVTGHHLALAGRGVPPRCDVGTDAHPVGNAHDRAERHAITQQEGVVPGAPPDRLEAGPHTLRRRARGVGVAAGHRGREREVELEVAVARGDERGRGVREVVEHLCLGGVEHGHHTAPRFVVHADRKAVAAGRAREPFGMRVGEVAVGRGEERREPDARRETGRVDRGCEVLDAGRKTRDSARANHRSRVDNRHRAGTSRTANRPRARGCRGTHARSRARSTGTTSTSRRRMASRPVPARPRRRARPTAPRARLGSSPATSAMSCSSRGASGSTVAPPSHASAHTSIRPSTMRARIVPACRSPPRKPMHCNGDASPASTATCSERSSPSAATPGSAWNAACTSASASARATSRGRHRARNVRVGDHDWYPFANSFGASPAGPASQTRPTASSSVADEPSATTDQRTTSSRSSTSTRTDPTSCAP